MLINSITTERFWQNVVIGENDEDKCWEWAGATNKGYARFLIDNEWHQATKIAWILTNGPIPEGGRIRRYCGNPLCVNPHHAELLHDDTKEERFWARVDIILDGSSCWEWQGARNEAGYGSTHIMEGDMPAATHRIAYELENGPIPEGMFVTHVCDNPSCCRPSHLMVGTAWDNTHDMMRKGRNNIGERNGQAVLTWEIVREIRALYAGGMGIPEIAKKFGVSHGAVWAVCLWKTWRE